MQTILIVEDDEKVAQALGIRIKSAGYAVLTASDGLKGLSLALSGKPDLVLLDMRMPEAGGASVAYRLNEFAPTTPVIFLTASKDDSLRRVAKELGAAAFFEKPYEPAELMDTIARVLNEKKQATERLVSKGRKKILIVEDDSKIAMALAIRIRAAGYHATLAHDALNGVSAAVNLKPDLVLLDISMPAGNGFTVAERIQTLIIPFTPIIFLTASKAPGLREKAKEFGAAGYFEKPFDPEQLLAAIDRILDATQPKQLADLLP